MKTAFVACKRNLIWLLHFLTKPITCQPAFFVLLYVLLNVLDIYSLYFLNNYIPFFKTLSGFFFCYLLSLPVLFLSQKFRKIYKTLVLIFSIFFFIVDFYLINVYGDTFHTFCPDIVGIIMATNPREANEFISNYIVFDKIVILLLVVFFLVFIFYLLRRRTIRLHLWHKCVLLILILISGFQCVTSISRIKNNNIVLLFKVEHPDLRKYVQNPVVETGTALPDNIVLLLGESFGKSHSSLYGYEKNTNPLLVKMEADSMLYVYENITAAGLSTIPAIKAIMMGYTDEMADSIEWYRCLTILEVMKEAGYKVTWLSNQIKSGLYTNEVGCFADLSNEQFFVDDKGVYAFTKENSTGYFDERLVYELEKLENDIPKNFYVIHMMGSHFLYDKRYPSEFARLAAEDYSKTHAHLSVDNRQKVAEYDNSILYNDSVVYEIMKRFENKDAVVVYFSDHGQDVFDSSDDYAGHAKIGNAKSEEAGENIPFMVYTSELFREKHPGLQQRIENAVNRPYRTDSIMYTIMDIAGVETVNGVSYKHKSLFK